MENHRQDFYRTEDILCDISKKISGVFPPQGPRETVEATQKIKKILEQNLITVKFETPFIESDVEEFKREGTDQITNDHVQSFRELVERREEEFVHNSMYLEQGELQGVFKSEITFLNYVVGKNRPL